MLGLMQDHPLLVSSILTHAERHHAGGRGRVPPVGRQPAPHDLWRGRVQGALPGAGLAGIGLSRPATGWAPSRGTGSGTSRRTTPSAAWARSSTPSTRASRPDDIAHIVIDAQDGVLLADLTFVPLLGGIAPALAGHVRAVVWLCTSGEMPDVALPPGMDSLCYETLLADAGDAFAWPALDERMASALCYTSGTTGPAEGRAVQPSIHRVACVRGQHGRRVRPAHRRPGAAGGADVPRERMGHSLCRADGGRDAGVPGPAPGWRQPAGPDGVRAGDVLGGRADRVARVAATPAAERHADRYRQSPDLRRQRVPAGADGRVPRGVRGAGGPRLGHDGNEPAGHVRRAEGGRGGGERALQAGPRRARHRHQDRGRPRHGAAVGRGGVRQPHGARPLGDPALHQRRGGRDRRRRAGSPRATSPRSTRRA